MVATAAPDDLMTRYRPKAEGRAETWAVRWQQAWEHRIGPMLEMHEAMCTADGWIGSPLVVAWNGVVFDGHHRLLIAWLLGVKVPYLVLPEGPTTVQRTERVVLAGLDGDGDA